MDGRENGRILHQGTRDDAARKRSPPAPRGAGNHFGRAKNPCQGGCHLERIFSICFCGQTPAGETWADPAAQTERRPFKRLNPLACKTGKSALKASAIQADRASFPQADSRKKTMMVRKEDNPVIAIVVNLLLNNLTPPKSTQTQRPDLPRISENHRIAQAPPFTPAEAVNTFSCSCTQPRPSHHRFGKMLSDGQL